MKITWFHYLITLLSVLLSFISTHGKRKPNFIVIVSESHPVSALGVYKEYLSRVDPTPNIDHIAKKGFIFSNTFCTNATPVASSTVLLTGIHSHVNALSQNGIVPEGSHDSLPKSLQEIGYETILLGRWNLSRSPKYFDHWNILTDPTEKYNPEFKSLHNQKRIEGYSTDIITDLAIEWLMERKLDKPFFLLIQFNATTKPWLPAIRHLSLYDDILLPEPINLDDKHVSKASPSRYQSMDIMNDLNFSNDLFFQPEQFDENKSKKDLFTDGQKNLELMTAEQLSAWTLSWRPKNEAFLRETQSEDNILQWKFQRYVKNYLRCIRGIDDNIKRIENILSETNSSDAFLVYTSNHGRMLGEHGWYGSKWMYEESMQIPLILSTDLSQKNGKMVNALVQNLDLAPTILDYAKSANFKNMQGRSLRPLIENLDSNSTWRNSVYYHFKEFPGDQMVAKHYGVRTKDFKLIHFYQFDEWEFYNLSKDPLEMENLYNDDDFKVQIRKLKDLLLENRKKYQDRTDTSIMPEEWRKIYRGPEARKE